MAFDSPALLPPLLHVSLPVMAFGFKQWKPGPCCKSYLSQHCSIPLHWLPQACSLWQGSLLSCFLVLCSDA